MISATRAPAADSQPSPLPIDDALARLKATDRNVVLMRYEHDLGLEEIARRLGISHNAARKRLSRALRRLQRDLSAVSAGLAIEEIPPILQKSIEHAPAHLAGQVATSAATGAWLPAASTIAGKVSTTMKLLKLKMAAVAGGFAVGVALGTFAVMQMRAAIAAAPALTPQSAIPSPMANGDPLKQSQADADKNDWSAAIDNYARSLADTPIDNYRDKKDFGWIIDQYARQSAGNNGAVDFAPLTAIFQQKLEDHPHDSIFTWRLHRALADIAEKNGDVDTQKKELQAAIAAYPNEADPQPSKLSSLQHLYNEYAMILAQSDVAAAEDFIRDRFQSDPRFLYFFTGPWKTLFHDKKMGEEYMKLTQDILDLYGQKAAANPAKRELLLRYQRELEAERASESSPASNPIP